MNIYLIKLEVSGHYFVTAFHLYPVLTLHIEIFYQSSLHYSPLSTIKINKQTNKQR